MSNVYRSEESEVITDAHRSATKQIQFKALTKCYRLFAVRYTRLW